MTAENILFLGDDYKLTENISVRQPTVSEILRFDENKYYSLVSIFTSSPFDMIAQLDSIGIDFTKITSYQMFCLFLPSLKREETSILFGDTDFSRFRTVKDSDNIVTATDGKSFFSEQIYMLNAEYLRKMNNLPPQKYKKVGNEATKKRLIQYAYDDLQKSSRKKNKSFFLDCLSFCNAVSGGNYTEILQMPVYVFLDMVKRNCALKYTEILYNGIYSGCVDLSKINKKELDFVRSLS
jgi:hypothetical protein